MKLSVLCITDFPAARVAAILAQLRPIAGEVVLAIDSRLDEAETAKYAATADRLIRYEYCGAMERALAWAHAQCRGDWILRIDGDEVASPALISAIPQLIAHGRVVQYQIPRRWAFPDSGHWLNELPWSPDYQIRLVRNDDTLWFEGLTHTGATSTMPARYLETPIYHLNLLMLSRDQREQRIERIYKPYSQGILAPGGGSVNRFYFPERFSRMDPSPVPADDRAAIEQVLSAVDVAHAQSGPVALATRADIDRWWNSRTPSDHAYRARLEPIERDHRMTVGEGRVIHLRITNLGDETWPWGYSQRPEIRVSYHWLNPDGTTLVPEGLRSAFPCPVRPGEQVIVPVGVMAPEVAGDFILEYDLVHELVRWFNCQLRVNMQVMPKTLPQADEI
jgi:hypothetical protein